MRRFAELSGFEGDDADWLEEYQMSLSMSWDVPNLVKFADDFCGKTWKGRRDSKYLDSLGLAESKSFNVESKLLGI